MYVTTYATKGGSALMDQVLLTARVLKALADKGQDYTVTAQHFEERMVFVEPTKYVGQGKGKWVLPSGQPRDGGKL
jgi:hypothetical protein